MAYGGQTLQTLVSESHGIQPTIDRAQTQQVPVDINTNRKAKTTEIKNNYTNNKRAK